MSLRRSLSRNTSLLGRKPRDWVSSTKTVRRIAMGTFRISCLRIDRRKHLDLALERQNEEEERFQASLQAPDRAIVEVRNQHQLDQVMKAFDNALLVLFFYSKACGSCKEVLQHFDQIRAVYGQQNARVVFVKHNVRDDFDDLTDVTRIYQIHSVPSFLLLSDGAVMKRIQYQDSRHAASPSIPQRLLRNKAHLADMIRRILFKVAPSASD